MPLKHYYIVDVDGQGKIQFSQRKNGHIIVTIEKRGQLLGLTITTDDLRGLCKSLGG